MPVGRMISTAGVSLCLLALFGCASGVTPPAGSVLAATATPGIPSTAPEPTASESTAPDPSESSSTASPQPGGEESLTEAFDYGNFTDPITIDNRWLPLVVGTQRVLEGSATVDGERIKRKVVITTTDLTKVIDGVRTVVNYELDYNSGDLVEAELAFYAQDDDAMVWLVGEYPEEYEDGKFVEAPFWIAGSEDAKAGIMMQSDPSVATPSYSEGWGPKVGWNDRGRVFETGSVTCVPAACFKVVLVIDEFNRDEPDAHQLKYYAEGVGNVRVGWAGAKEEEQETLELVKLVQLSPDALAKVRAAALALDQHAYVVSKDVYGRTAPAQPR
jgi:hypothetical protein